jgi:hypothetical protein
MNKRLNMKMLKGRCAVASSLVFMVVPPASLIFRSWAATS